MTERVVLRGQRPRVGLLLAAIVLVAMSAALAAGGGYLAFFTDADLSVGVQIGAALFGIVALVYVCEAAKMAGLLRVATVYFEPEGYRVVTPFLPGTRHKRAPRNGEPTSLMVNVTQSGDWHRHQFSLVQESSVARFSAFVPLTATSVDALVQAFAWHGTPLKVQRGVVGKSSRRASVETPPSTSVRRDVARLAVSPGAPDSIELHAPELRFRYTPHSAPPAHERGAGTSADGSELTDLGYIHIFERDRAKLIVSYEPPSDHDEETGFELDASHEFVTPTSRVAVLDIDDTAAVMVAFSAPVAGVDIYVRDGNIPDAHLHVRDASAWAGRGAETPERWRD